MTTIDLQTAATAKQATGVTLATGRIRRHRHFLARAVAVTALAAATISFGAGTASAMPSCVTLARAIDMMTRAAELSRQGGFDDVARQRAETAIYYASLYEKSCLA
jgi:hypothetical protein